jgi:hypothetical protein
MMTTSTTATAPLFNVRRWTGRGWRAVSPPLDYSAALQLADRLKSKGVSSFHVRVVGAAPVEVQA